MKRVRNDPDTLEEYDFSGGVRGEYAKRYVEGTNVVVIDPDVVEYFPDRDAVNERCAGWPPSSRGSGKPNQRLHAGELPCAGELQCSAALGYICMIGVAPRTATPARGTFVRPATPLRKLDPPQIVPQT